MSKIDIILMQTAERLPTVDELIEIAEELGWSFRFDNGKPSLNVDVSDPVAVGFVRLIKREPWRTKLIERLQSSHEERKKEAIRLLVQADDAAAGIGTHHEVVPWVDSLCRSYERGDLESIRKLVPEFESVCTRIKNGNHP